jgi:hypothetical protein
VTDHEKLIAAAFLGSILFVLMIGLLVMRHQELNRDVREIIYWRGMCLEAVR